MNNRLKSGLVALGLSVIAVPTIVAARTHYTGKVPASISLAPERTTSSKLTTTVAAPLARTTTHKAATHKATRKASAHTAVAHKAPTHVAAAHAKLVAKKKPAATKTKQHAHHLKVLHQKTAG